MPKFQSPTGMRDIFQNELKYFEKIEKTCKQIAEFYGFGKIETPILEQTELFEKGVGLSSDIVEKEMFSLKTKGGTRLTLRPEITAGVARAYIEHGMQSMPKPVNLWYFGKCFRHERPQAGRYREFHQFGFESFGVSDPSIDALIIEIAYNILNEIGLKNLIIEINSIGDNACRPYYKKSLTAYFRSKKSFLCADCKQRLKKNPLRILDCKQKKCREIAEKAPQTIDHLCKDCHNYLKNLLEYLDEIDIPYNLNPYLVRGLDYYTRTVFEIYEDTEIGKEQGALAGGGRYDGLIKLYGGKDTPACGFAIGAERIVNLLKQKQTKSKKQDAKCDVFLAQVGELAKKKSLKIMEEFRKNKIKIASSLHKDSLTSQLKIANKLNAKFVLILGQKEAINNKIAIKEMKTGKQKTIELSKLVKEIKKKIK